MIYSFKASETLLGIETVFGINTVATKTRFKASETLLGIETIKLKLVNGTELKASKPLKPF